MKTADEWVEELGSGMWASDVEKIQRDAWESACNAQSKAIINDVWGSWAQAGVESVKPEPFPGDVPAPPRRPNE